MRDIDIAKELLDKEQLSLVIVKKGEIVFTSKDRGIEPLYTAIKEYNDEIKEASIADRVTGKAAAMLCEYGDIKELHTKIISENALKVFKGTSILCKYDKSTSYIKNRDRTGMCPIETLSLQSNSIYDLLENISNFLESLER